LLKKLATVAALVIVVLLALHLLPRLAVGFEALTKAGERLPISEVVVSSDGPLEEQVVLQTLALGEGANLLSIDLEAMKVRLEGIGQVKQAIASRRFPGTLEVQIVERAPVARIRAQRRSGEELLLYVDREGVVFEAASIDPIVARSLPFLGGISLSIEGEGFAPVQGMRPVADLLADTQALAPHLNRYMRTLSIGQGGRLSARSRYAREIVFDLKADFRDQLGKLDYIVDYRRGLMRGARLGRVDLTLGSQVPVLDL